MYVGNKFTKIRKLNSWYHISKLINLKILKYL